MIRNFYVFDDCEIYIDYITSDRRIVIYFTNYLNGKQYIEYFDRRTLFNITKLHNVYDIYNILCFYISKNSFRHYMIDDNLILLSVELENYLLYDFKLKCGRLC